MPRSPSAVEDGAAIAEAAATNNPLKATAAAKDRRPGESRDDHG
jgi:hypothetical protein